MSKEDAPLHYRVLSEKSFAVFGDREKYEKEIKNIGGTWNPRIKPAGGWFINKKNKLSLDTLIQNMTSDVPSDMLALSQQGIPLKSGIKDEKPKNANPDVGLVKTHLNSINKKKIYETLEEKKEIGTSSRELTQSFDQKPHEDDEDPTKTDKDPEKTDEDPTKTDKDPTKTDEDPTKTDKDPDKTDEDDEKTDEDPEKTDEDDEKTDEDPEKTDEDPDKTDEDPDKTDEYPEKTDEYPEKTDEDVTMPVEKLGAAFDKRIGNPEQKLIVQRRNKFITDYVNSDDEIDDEESKIMLARFKNYFEYYKTYARSPEKFDTAKTKSARKNYTTS